MPPRHGKSETTSKWFPLWCLDNDPHTRVVLTSYAADFAASWGAAVRTLADEYAESLSFQRPPGGSANQWQTGHGRGGVVTAGVGGPITGKGGDVIIIDDPIKNAEEAHSQTMRQKTWDWYRSTLYTRLEPGSCLILVMTRWHHDDLAGRIKREIEEGRDLEEPDERDEEGDDEDWQFIDMAAEALPDDQLSREEGEPLWPERYPKKRLKQIKRAVGPWVWTSLYQQQPTADEGDIFLKAWFNYWSYKSRNRKTYSLQRKDEESGEIKWVHFPTSECIRFQTVDVATSERESADYFVVTTFALTPENDLLILDVMRDHVKGPRQMPVLRAQFQKWKPSIIGIESVAYQLALVQSAIDDGLPAIPLPVDGDKVARANLAGARYYAGKIFHPSGQPEWLEAFEKELLQFPNGEHDDQVDTVSSAAYAVAAKLIKKRRKRMAFNDDVLLKGSLWYDYDEDRYGEED